MIKFDDIAQLTVEALQDEKAEVTVVKKTSQHKRPYSTVLQENTDQYDEKEVRKERVRGHVTDMIDNSSLHGLNYICDERFTLRRIFWFVVTVSAFVISFEKVVICTKVYLKFPYVTLQTRLYAQELPFPAISFCNLNDMRMSMLRGSIIDQAVVNENAALIGNSSEAESWDLVKKSAHRITDMILRCKFNGEECSYKNFTQFYWKAGEKCFTFNDGKSERGVLKVKNSGRRSSLELTINLEHYEYYRDRSQAGIHLILHDQHETPVRLEGAMISPGFSTHVQIKQKLSKNLPSPYATRCGSKKLTFFKAYSKNLCWLDSLTKQVRKKCGCKDYFMPGKDIPVCRNATEMTCAWSEWEMHDKAKKYKKNCPRPCEIYTYSHQISRALYPSRAHAQYLSENFPVLREAYKNDTSKTREEKEFLRDTLVKLVIYYDELSFELIKQEPSYDTQTWLGDVGGTIGLFVGAGAMTYFEFIDCIGMVIHTWLFEKLPN